MSMRNVANVVLLAIACDTSQRMVAEAKSQLPPLAFETSYGDGDDVVLLFAIMSQRADPSSTKIIYLRNVLVCLEKTT